MPTLRALRGAPARLFALAGAFMPGADFVNDDATFALRANPADL